MVAAALLVLAWLLVAPALAAADVVVPPSKSPSALPSPTATSASPAALPATPASGSGGGALAATVGGGVAVLALAAASWVVLRRVAGRRAAGRLAQTGSAAAAGETEELD